MRKFLIKTVALAVLASLVLTSVAGAAALGTGVVDADLLRMRSGPGTGNAIITNLPDGTTVQVLEVLDGWYKVSYGEKTGYVSADYLDYTPAPVKEDAAADTEKETGIEAEMKVLTGKINADDVNFREGPAMEAKVLSRLAKDTAVTVLAEEGEWYKVSCKDAVGYVSCELVTLDEDERGIITGSCVNLRSGPSTDHKVLGKVYAGDVVELLSGEEDGWYHIRHKDVEGYISGDYVRVYADTASSGIGEEVSALALSFLGVPYAYGGASPKGFDCSGFTLYIFKQFGYSFPHSATSQWNSCGEYVERADLQPGDLVFFCDPSRSNGKACSHVGIYIGDDQFVHASSGSAGKYVRISSLNENYYNKYYKGAKRMG